MLIQGAEIYGRIADVRIADGRVRAIGANLPLAPGEPRLRADGGALLPGLHDHHLHLFALAAAMRSVPCGPPEVGDAGALAARLAGATPEGGWIRGVGYHESVAGELTRDVLDGLAPRSPVRIQHRSGAAWQLNSAAIAQIGLDAGGDAAGVERDACGRATGRLFGLDAWLRNRLPAGPAPDLAGVGRRLAAFGVTGVTDATPSNGPRELELFAAARAAGALRQELFVMGSADLPEGRGDGPVRGPVKIVLRETALPHPARLTRSIAEAHDAGRAVAIHCVTRAELVLAASALAEAGASAADRIEHASIAPPDAVALLAELGVTVVTQPNFLRERGDAYRCEVDADDQRWLYRCRGFLDAGIALAAGTDAPFGDPDPWRAMQAAVDRKSASGHVLATDECLSPEQALALFCAPAPCPGAAPRRIVVGVRADLCLLALPWKQVRDRLDATDVVATMGAGAILSARHPRR